MLYDSCTTVNYRKVTPDDWRQFKEIRLKGYQTDPQAFGGAVVKDATGDESFLHERLSREDRFFFVAEEDNIFVSIAGAKKVENGDWHLIAVYTIPEFRGKGISKKVCELVIEEIKLMGIEHMCLEVNIDQKNAVEQYKNMGFEIVEIEKDQEMADGKLHDEYYMKKYCK